MKKALLFFLLLSYFSNSQTAGSLDLLFGINGSTITDFNNSNDVANSIAIQTDGKIVSVGDSYATPSNSRFAIVRYNTDGSLDNSFGVNGKVITSIGTYSALAYSVKIQNDGKILVGGCSMNSNGSNWNLTLARYNTDGTLDSSFGTGGISINQSLSNGTIAWSIFIQQDGKIISSGMFFDGTFQNFAVFRYNSDGSLDTSFGTSGQSIIHVGSGHDFAVCMTQQNDGKILLGGYTSINSDLDIALVRFNSNGLLDSSFGNNGIVLTAISSSTDVATSIAIQSDGKIVLAGYTVEGVNTNIAVLRYNLLGTLDTTFGINGIVITQIGNNTDGANDIIIEPTGRLLIAGTTRNSSNQNNILLANFNPDGSLNTSFGTNGIVTSQIGSTHCDANTVKLLLDGKIIIGGRVYNGIDNDFLIARYNNFDDLGINELSINKKLIKIIDLIGRETEYKPNTPLIYIYNDGTIEKIFKIE